MELRRFPNLAVLIPKCDQVVNGLVDGAWTACLDVDLVGVHQIEYVEHFLKRPAVCTARIFLFVNG